MNPTTNGQTSADEAGPPPGYASWADVPDELIPGVLVSRPQWAGKAGWFIKGRIPVGQMTAAIVSGHAKAPLMLLALKLKTDIDRDSWVRPPMELLSDWRFSRFDRSRSIAALEKAGLLEVERHAGRPPLLRLVPWGRSANGQASVSP